MRIWKYVLTVILPAIGVAVILGSCASHSTCKSDACYDRKLASTDPFTEGEVASWGTEKQVAKREKEKDKLEKKAERDMLREFGPRRGRTQQ